MAMAFNLKDAIVEAVTGLGGSGTAVEVREYLRSKYGKEWKNIETIMDDLSVESKSSFFPPEDRVLRQAGSGRYSLKETAASELPEPEILAHEAHPTTSEITNNTLERTNSVYLAKLKQIIDQPALEFAEANSEQVPDTPGIYIIHDKSLKRIIYAEKSGNLRIALLQHKRGNNKGGKFREKLGQELGSKSELEISDYIMSNCSFQFLAVESFEERVRFEHFIAAVLAPVFNIEFQE